MAELLDDLEMPVGKAVLAIADQAQALHRTVAVFEWQGQVVGPALGGHLVQDLMVTFGV